MFFVIMNVVNLFTIIIKIILIVIIIATTKCFIITAIIIVNIFHAIFKPVIIAIPLYLWWPY